MNVADKPNLANHHHVLKSHHDRITKLEQHDANLDEVLEVVRAIFKWVRIGGPMVATAAVTSGLVSGKWGAFFHALLSGS
jgi:hypothetical protein